MMKGVMILAFVAGVAAKDTATQCGTKYGEGANTLCAGPGLSFGMSFLDKATASLGKNPAITAYKQFRGADVSILDNQLRLALNSSNFGDTFMKFVSGSEFQPFVIKAAMPVLGFLLVMIIIGIAAPCLCCARCTCICGEHMGTTCCGSCGPDVCCRPKKHFEEYTGCSKFVVVGFWAFFAILAFCFALVSIVNSGLIFNGTTKTMCTFGGMPDKFSNYTDNVATSIDLVVSETGSALTDLQKYTTDINNLGPKLDDLNAAVTKMICPKFWDTASCSDAGFGAEVLACLKAATPTYPTSECGATGNSDSICCFQVPASKLPPTANAALNYYVPNVAVQAATKDGKFGKELATVTDSVKSAKDGIKSANDASTKASKETNDKINGISNSAKTGLQTVTNATSSATLVDASCSGKEYLAMGKDYAYYATAIFYVFVFFSVFFGLFGIIALMLCKPTVNPNPSEGGVKVAKFGCCLTQCSWLNAMAFMMMLSLIGLFFFIFSLVVGDMCYTVDNIPKVGFDNYFGDLMKGMGGNSSGGMQMNPIAIVDTCWTGGDVLPALGISLPANGTSGSFDTSQIDKMGDDVNKLSLGELDAQKSALVNASAGFAAKIDDIDKKLADIKSDVLTIQTGLKSSLQVGLGKVDAALAGTMTKLNDCGFIKDIYMGFSNALCQDGLEGLLWMTLGTLLVVWCGIPMLITSIFINIRMSGLGQHGKIMKDCDGPAPAPAKRNNLSTDNGGGFAPDAQVADYNVGPNTGKTVEIPQIKVV